MWTKEDQQRYHREWVRALKKVVFDWYGGKCRCCGETLLDALTLDHIKDDGVREFGGMGLVQRLKKGINNTGSGYPLYSKIKKLGFKDRPRYLQILCWNCQWGKKIGKGFCGHHPDIDLRKGDKNGRIVDVLSVA